MPSSEHAAQSSELSPWVTSLAHWMDSKFRVPGTTIRFGLDPLIGLVPALGDTATLLIGMALLREAARLGTPRRVYAQMIGNLLLDWFVGLIPGVDLIADTAVKAHSKTARLLARHAGARASDPAAARPETERTRAVPGTQSLRSGG